MATDPLDKLLDALAREYTGPTAPTTPATPPEPPYTAASPPNASAPPTGRAPRASGPVADALADDVHPALRALLSDEAPGATPGAFVPGGLVTPPDALRGPTPPAARSTPVLPAEVAPRAQPITAGQPELAMLASIQDEEAAALRQEEARLRQEAEVQRLRAEVERRRQEEATRRQQEAERQQQEAARQRQQAEERVRQQQEERRRQEVERAIRVQAEQWLKQLDPNSSEGEWFNQYAQRYPDRLQAAVDYLREVKGLG